MQLFLSVYLVTLLVKGSAGQELPRISKMLPLFDLSPAASQAEQESAVDEILRSQFPGQFFTADEISSINNKDAPARRKREVDKDLCCQT